jgi:putative transposase
MRDEVFSKNMFCNLAPARAIISVWATDHNAKHPHLSLKYRGRTKYARALANANARPASHDESSARRAIV